ncbi:hypothetical protein GCM10023088_51560 [Actinomadura verrucosospora]|uniref:hypothetical protein n=1 Tax=Actinomadura verrucosospora TaxID=46165 RepID=UPI0031E8B1E6
MRWSVPAPTFHANGPPTPTEARAGVAEEIAFATKPELGQQILADLHAEGRLPDWVTGDGIYGRDPVLRAWLKSDQVSFTACEEGKCKDKVRELNSVRGTAAADLMTLHSTSLKTVAPCDSGDPPYLSTRLNPSIRPEQATRRLEGNGWRIAETYRRPR